MKYCRFPAIMIIVVVPSQRRLVSHPTLTSSHSSLIPFAHRSLYTSTLKMQYYIIMEIPSFHFSSFQHKRQSMS